MKIVLTPHGGSGNHGCEAIVRSTAKILKGHSLELFSSVPEQDIAVGLNNVCKVYNQSAPVNRLSFRFIRAKLNSDNQAIDTLSFAPVVTASKKADIVMSIGGDNYCYGINNHILLVNRIVREMGKKTVLWGCSIESDAIDEPVIFDDLKHFTLIIARESLTYNTLQKKGLTNVKLYPDPAFLLDRKDLLLPDKFIEGNTVGINISPMIVSYEKNQGSTLANYINLIEYIISSSDMQVALIPHVVWKHNDDRIPLRQLYDHFASTGRVVIIEDCNAMELKGYIGRCRYFIAARTHASIAAYSQCIPTLVVGYSIKARGIAHDIFESENDYVIPVQSLDREDKLTDAFKNIQQKEPEIKKHYASIMKKYIAKASEVSNELLKL